MRRWPRDSASCPASQARRAPESGVHSRGAGDAVDRLEQERLRLQQDCRDRERDVVVRTGSALRRRPDRAHGRVSQFPGYVLPHCLADLLVNGPLELGDCIPLGLGIPDPDALERAAPDVEDDPGTRMVSQFSPCYGICFTAAIFAERSRAEAYCAAVTAMEGIIVLDSGRPGAADGLLARFWRGLDFGGFRVVGGRSGRRGTLLRGSERHRSGCRVSICRVSRCRVGELDGMTVRIRDQAKQPAHCGIANQSPLEPRRARLPAPGNNSP